jgi:hypothetical protein
MRRQEREDQAGKGAERQHERRRDQIQTQLRREGFCITRSQQIELAYVKASPNLRMAYQDHQI